MNDEELQTCMFSAFGEAKWRLLGMWLGASETNSKRWFFGERPLPDHLQIALRFSAAEVERLVEGLDKLIETAKAGGVDDIMIAHRLMLYAKDLPRHPRPPRADNP